MTKELFDRLTKLNNELTIANKELHKFIEDLQNNDKSK